MGTWCRVSLFFCCILSWCSNRVPSSLGLGRAGFKIVPRSLGSACAVSDMRAQTAGDMAIEYILMLCRQIGRLGSWIVGLRYALFASTPLIGCLEQDQLRLG